MHYRQCRALQALSRPFSWISLGKPQQTLASEIVLSGTGLHSGIPVTVRLSPSMAGVGRYFVMEERNGRLTIPATIDHTVDSVLCTTLAKGVRRVRTVEHLLSALEGCGVDNCSIEIHGGEEVPLLDGSAKQWVEAIKQVGVCAAKDSRGGHKEKMAPFLHNIKYAPAIGHQWFSCLLDDDAFFKNVASSRTFCIYEEVERMHKAGLIQGGSAENAIVCSTTAGWLNPPLRFSDEPCRHKVLDLVGDLSLFARNGNQGLPFAHIIAYKAGHSLHAEFVRRLSNIF